MHGAIRKGTVAHVTKIRIKNARLLSTYIFTNKRLLEQSRELSCNASYTHIALPFTESFRIRM